MIRAALLSTMLLSPACASISHASVGTAAGGSASVRTDDGTWTADASGADPAAEAGAPMVVTTDTDAYCDTLERQIEQHAGTLPRPVLLLRDQGRHLCDTGQVRGGINRLRRALRALRDPVQEDDMDEGSGH